MSIYNRYSLEQFINKSNKQFNNRYDYSQVEYKSNYQKVKIQCPDHGEFYITPISHANGEYCSECKDTDFVKFNKQTIEKYKFNKHYNWTQHWNNKLDEIITRNGILYIIKYHNLYKIGITSLSVKKRFPLCNYEVLAEIDFKNINYARYIERTILNEYNEYQQKPIGWEGGGETEFIQVSDLEIFNIIEAVTIHQTCCL